MVEQAGGGNIQFNNLITTRRSVLCDVGAYLRSSLVTTCARLPSAVQDYPFERFPVLTFANIQLRRSDSTSADRALPQSGKDNIYQEFDPELHPRAAHFKFGGEFKRILSNQDFLTRGRGDYIYDDSRFTARLSSPRHNAKRGRRQRLVRRNISKYFASRRR